MSANAFPQYAKRKDNLFNETISVYIQINTKERHTHILRIYTKLNAENYKTILIPTFEMARISPN